MNNEVMDTHPKEQFVFHAAGLGGRGSASYIDSVAFRDKDTTAWTANGRTPLDQRHYSLLNWRSDVVVIVTDAGALVQHARYNDSGSPWGVPAGDVNGDGIVNTVDTGIVLGAIGGAYVARYDLNLDGTVDAADHTIANNNLGDTLGHNALSLNPSSDVRGGHRLGYTGHTHADFNNALIVMRHRWYSGDLGRFVSRDPMGFVDGANVYAYARGNGVSGRDAMGLCNNSLCTSKSEPLQPVPPPPPTTGQKETCYIVHDVRPRGNPRVRPIAAGACFVWWEGRTEEERMLIMQACVASHVAKEENEIKQALGNCKEKCHGCIALPNNGPQWIPYPGLYVDKCTVPCGDPQDGYPPDTFEIDVNMRLEMLVEFGICVPLTYCVAPEEGNRFED